MGGGNGLVTFLINAYLGVSLFFVLSGFILTYTYREGVESLRAFAITRFARIYPVYLFALLIALPLAYRALGERQFVAVLAMVQAWTHYPSAYGYAWITQAWTLSVEIGFYLCFPALMFLLRRLNRSGLIFGLSVVCAAIVSAGSQSLAPGSIRPDLPVWVSLVPLPLLRLPEFALGMLTCELFLRFHTGTPGHGWRLGLAVPLTLASIVYILSTQRDHLHTLGFIPILFAALLCQLAAGSTRISRFLSSKPLLLLGGASYALYLLQGPVRAWIRVVIPRETVGRMLNPVIAIAASIAVYLLVEKPVRGFVLRSFLGMKSRPA